jgi:hypothetical protein
MNRHWNTFRAIQELGGCISLMQNVESRDGALEMAIGDIQPDIVSSLLDYGAMPKEGSFRLLVRSLKNTLRGAMVKPAYSSSG